MQPRSAISVYIIGLVTITQIAGGCVRVPELDQPLQPPTTVLTKDVVARVKCELADAVMSNYYTHPGLAWLNSWSARIHLTLIVDDTSSLTPGLLVTSPFHNAYNRGIGPGSVGGAATYPAIAQAFSLGLGGGLTTEATRTEDLEFDLSIKELEKDFHKPTQINALHGCSFKDTALLESDLGLKEWVNAALSPVVANPALLKIGPNPPPGGSGTPIPYQEALKDLAAEAKQAHAQQNRLSIEGSRFTEAVDKSIKFNLPDLFNKSATTTQSGPNITLTPQQIRELEEDRKQLALITTTRGTQVAQSKLISATAKLFDDGILKPMITAITNTPKCLTALQPMIARAEFAVALSNLNAEKIEKGAIGDLDIERVKIQIAAIDGTTPSATKLSQLSDSLNKLKSANDALNKTLADQKSEELKIENSVYSIIKEYGACTNPSLKAPEPVYDPLALISHQVNFIITSSGSITPTWKLARITVPNSPNLIAASRKNTNTLIIALGRTGDPSVKTQIQTSQIRAVLAGQ